MRTLSKTEKNILKGISKDWFRLSDILKNNFDKFELHIKRDSNLVFIAFPDDKQYKKLGKELQNEKQLEIQQLIITAINLIQILDKNGYIIKAKLSSISPRDFYLGTKDYTDKLKPHTIEYPVAD